VVFLQSFKKTAEGSLYFSFYQNQLEKVHESENVLLKAIEASDLSNPESFPGIIKLINDSRTQLKEVDFWFRYLEPIAYRKLNGPLPVEWETEVFEKFEKPYKREGAGLTLAALYLEESDVNKDSLISLIRSSLTALETFRADSVTTNLKTFHHFYLCNRLFLLNLSSIYTTGFECPDTSRVIPELRLMMDATTSIYRSFDESFVEKSLTPEYINLYNRANDFVKNQPQQFSLFDHFTFIRDYVNPLYRLNQDAIIRNKVVSRSFVDYSLNKKNSSIFDKDLYRGQNAKGIFLRVTDEVVLSKIDKVGKLLFYDPILSGNNKRSCASCHKPTEYFTDTSGATALKFNGNGFLPRNTPSLINAGFNHLLMMDGIHISLQNQAKAVLTNPTELGSDENKLIEKIQSCPDYKKVFQELLKFTPQEEAVTIDHVTSAISFYYDKFSRYYSPFDEAVNNNGILAENEIRGFNLFMSKTQCATCHFVPQFNGVKPPYVGSEFEVLGVPEDTGFNRISDDKGRFNFNPAFETMNAFRTGSLRNSIHTAPYMHNGVFRTMEEVLDFYDSGGGAGKGLQMINQTLSEDSLHLTRDEKKCIIAFLNSLNEKIQFETPPEKLPLSRNKVLNGRKIGGEY
jgi:cytochrome c peroxidase